MAELQEAVMFYSTVLSGCAYHLENTRVSVLPDSFDDPEEAGQGQKLLVLSWTGGVG